MFSPPSTPPRIDAVPHNHFRSTMFRLPDGQSVTAPSRRAQPPRVRGGLLLHSLVALALLAGCGKTPPPRAHDFTKPSGPARVEATLQLPAGDGRVHIVAIPGEFAEVTRCVIATSASGAISATCAPKALELIADSQ